MKTDNIYQQRRRRCCCATSARMAQVDEAAAKLVDLAAAFSKNPPRSLAVVVGLAGAAYRRPDGVYVLPLTALRPK